MVAFQGEGDEDVIKNDEQRQKCQRVLLAIETEGGPKKASAELIKEAEDLKMVVRGKGRWNYSLKANTLRREMMQEVAKGGKAIVALLTTDDAKPGPAGEAPAMSLDGHVVDVSLCGVVVRARARGFVRWHGGDVVLCVLEHWRAGAWETFAVPFESLKEVTKDQL